MKNLIILILISINIVDLSAQMETFAYLTREDKMHEFKLEKVGENYKVFDEKDWNDMYKSEIILYNQGNGKFIGKGKYTLRAIDHTTTWTLQFYSDYIAELSFNTMTEGGFNKGGSNFPIFAMKSSGIKIWDVHNLSIKGKFGWQHPKVKISDLQKTAVKTFNKDGKNYTAIDKHPKIFLDKYNKLRFKEWDIAEYTGGEYGYINYQITNNNDFHCVITYDIHTTGYSEYGLDPLNYYYSGLIESKKERAYFLIEERQVILAPRESIKLYQFVTETAGAYNFDNVRMNEIPKSIYEKVIAEQILTQQNANKYNLTAYNARFKAFDYKIEFDSYPKYIEIQEPKLVDYDRFFDNELKWTICNKGEYNATFEVFLGGKNETYVLDSGECEVVSKNITDIAKETLEIAKVNKIIELNK